MNKMKKLIERHDILKIFSVMVAIILFLTVNPVLSNPIWNSLFESQDTLEQVSLTTKYDDDKYIISGVPTNIDVVVSGNSEDVQNISGNQEALIASLDLSRYTPGSYDIDNDLVSFNMDGATMQPIQEKFTISVQEKVVKDMPVSLSYINGDKLEQGVLIDKKELNQSSISVRGGNEDIDSVTTIFALTDLSKLNLTANQNSDTLEVPLVAYDKDGNRVNNIQLEPSSVNVSFEYTIQSQKLPVVYEYFDNNTGKYVSSICPIGESSCDENYVEQVEIYGDVEKINKLSSITYQVDLSKVNEEGGEVKGKPVLESEVYIIDEDEHTYNVKFEDGKSKELKGVTINMSGLSSEFTAVATDASNSTVDVKITGAKSIVDGITASDVQVYIDLTSYSQPGIYDVPLLVRHNNNVTYTLSKEQIQIEIKEKEGTTGDEK